MEIAGYQSDITINEFNIEENFPIEQSLGGFGVTTGTQENVYELALTPKLTKPYEPGLQLQVRFHQVNTDAAVINVDGLGEVPLVKPFCKEEDVDGRSHSTKRKKAVKTTEVASLVPLEANELSPELHYILLYNGTSFQVVNICQPKAGNVIVNPDLNVNTLTPLELKDEHVNAPFIEYSLDHNRYVAINSNLIVVSDIRLKDSRQLGTWINAMVKLPIPLDQRGDLHYGTLESRLGVSLIYRMDRKGIVRILGEMPDPTDDVIFNINPYVAKFPLEFDEGDFPNIT